MKTGNARTDFAPIPGRDPLQDEAPVKSERTFNEPSDLEDLRRRLDKKRVKSEDGQSPRRGGADSLGLGLRVATDLVAALCVGGALGWGLDALFKTSPLFLIIFFFLGMAAGILNVYRTGQSLQQPPED